jgi:hypothetical protein
MVEKGEIQTCSYKTKAKFPPFPPFEDNFSIKFDFWCPRRYSGENGGKRGNSDMFL